MSDQQPTPITQSGRTVDDAVQRALRRMGLARADVDVDVVEEGRHGIFGIGQSQATVRVTPKPGTEPAGPTRQTAPPLPKIDDYADPTEVEPGRRPGRRGSGRPQRRLDPERYGNRDDRPNTEEAAHDDAPTNIDTEAEPSTETDDAAAAEPAPDHRDRARPQRGDGPRYRRGRGRSRDQERPQARPPLPPFELLADPEFEPSEDPRQFAVELLTDIAHLLGFNVQVVARDPETPMDGLDHAIAVLDVDPIEEEDLGLLIGRHGSHVAALQYVVNVILSRALEGNNPITVDVDGYRRRREEALVDMASRAGSEVRDYGEPVELGAMPAAERRIIHLQFQEDPELTTRSIGSGPGRRVQILYRDDA